MRQFVAAVILMGMACGGAAESEETATTVQAAATTPAGSGSATETNGAVHTVNMVITDAGEYRFQPDELTIKVGDTVRWVNVSGGPHNVQFRADGIPDGAAAVLNAAMQGRTMGNLMGNLLTAPNAVYEIVFADAPTGTYDYTCTPHELLGMNATMTIEE